MRLHTQPVPSRRSGFTLIEVLIVIAIIGILIGLLIPVAGIAFKTVKKRALAMEVSTLSDAVEKYREKYGDYPPDGSSGAVFQQHLRKIFPQIAASELALISGFSNDARGTNSPPDSVMDPAEALVFFLGGFSTDPIYPISGVGGPIHILHNNGSQTTSATPPQDRNIVQYNVDRTNPLYEFKQSQLSLDVVIGRTVSNDETVYFPSSGASFDLMPVYHPSGLTAPFVYFDARTYKVGAFYNYYGSVAAADATFGLTRPYRSDEVLTTTTVPEQYYRYMNEKSFQLHSAGIDDVFGQEPWSGSGGGPIFFRFPSGQAIDFGPVPPVEGQFQGYKDRSGIQAQLDNATNFSEGVLGDSISE